MSIEILEKSENKGAVKMIDCIFTKTFRDNEAEDIGYASICNTDFAVTEAFNKKIKLIRNNCLMNGDSCCLFEYAMGI